MRSPWKQFVLATALASALLPAFAQSAGPQNSGIDPALLSKATAGDPAAQVQVGESYAAGKDVARDLTQAAEWYRKAADKNDIAAELHLAALYRDGGKSFPRDPVQSASWYRKAAEQGDATAQATLGLLYSLGQGVAKSDVEAYFWLDLAASAKGPKQEQYAQNRQLIGTHITTDELEEVQERVAKWKASHPRPTGSE
jgi:TPR repeat protein